MLTKKTNCDWCVCEKKIGRKNTLTTMILANEIFSMLLLLLVRSLFLFILFFLVFMTFSAQNNLPSLDKHIILCEPAITNINTKSNKKIITIEQAKKQQQQQRQPKRVQFSKYIRIEKRRIYVHNDTVEMLYTKLQSHTHTIRNETR